MNERLLKFTKTDLYKVASAIRGCDLAGIGLKRIFTARIRYLVDIYSTPTVVRRTPRVEWEDIKSAVAEIVANCDDGLKRSAYYHYLDHVGGALEALRAYDLISVREYKFLIRLIVAFEHIMKEEMDYLCATGYVKKMLEEFKEYIEGFPEVE